MVQMAKVGNHNHTELVIKLYSKWMKHIVVSIILQLVCEEVNVDRFYPVLYPKVAAFFPPFPCHPSTRNHHDVT